MGRHASIVAQQSRERRRGARVVGLRKKAPGQVSRQCARRDQEPKARAPPERCLQDAAGQRRDDRSKPHQHAHGRKLAAGAHAFVHVAHHRAHRHDRARNAERLQEAPGDQHRNRGREEADQGRRAVEDKRQDDNRFAANAVRDRPVHDLADREADQIERDRKLDVRRRRRQCGRDRRHRRQVEVNGQRTEARQEREQRSERERIRAKHETGDRKGSRQDRTADPYRGKPGLGEMQSAEAGNASVLASGSTRTDANRRRGRRARPWRDPSPDRSRARCARSGARG